MNVEAFRNAETSRDKEIFHKCTFSDLSYGGLEWSEWYKLAAMTRNIDYGCRFGKQIKNGVQDKQATCSKQREYNTTDEMCCCSSCNTKLGYLKFIQNDPKVIKRIAGLFQPKTGFWRKGKGCILPRKYRSAVCLGYRCESAKRYEINSMGKTNGTERMLVLFMDSIRICQLSDRKIRILGKALLKSA